MKSTGLQVPPLSPSREEFGALAQHGNLIPVFTELPADLDTPLSAFLRLRPGPYAFLLESVEDPVQSVPVQIVPVTRNGYR